MATGITQHTAYTAVPTDMAHRHMCAHHHALMLSGYRATGKAAAIDATGYRATGCTARANSYIIALDIVLLMHYNKM